MLQVIVQEYKHTTKHRVNYLAYCDQLLLTQFILRTKLILFLSTFSIFAQYSCVHIHTCNGNNANKLHRKIALQQDQLKDETDAYYRLHQTLFLNLCLM